MSVKMAVYAGDLSGRPGWQVMFDYDQYAIEQIKTRIPADKRVWNPELKTWWFAEEIVEDVAKILPQLRAFLDQPRLPI